MNEKTASLGCRIMRFMDGGTSIVDNETNMEVWCHWDQNIGDALKWCGKNNYVPTHMADMEVKSFNPQTSTVELDFSTYNAFRMFPKTIVPAR